MRRTANRHATFLSSLALLGAALALGSPALAQTPLAAPASAGLADDIAGMLTGGTTRLALRYRLEDVEQDNALRNATASTLRTRLSFQSAALNDVTFAVEADNILGLGADHYDSFALDKYRGRYSVIADPVGTEINVAALSRALAGGRSVSLGRQRLNHGAQRFLGSVGWRQNEQTFDALSFKQNSDALSVDYSYLWNVNRVFKGSQPSAQAGDWQSNSHALLLGHKTPWGTVSGFVYALDFEDAPAASSLTTGVTVTGTFAPLTLSATYALQSDYGDNALSYDTDYLHLEASGKLGALTLLGGVEVLGSDGGRAGFATPLATLHRYQGFADLFLATPANGIEDRYLTLSGPAGKLALSLSYHDYAAARGSADYGDEWNALATWPVNPRLSVEAKYAAYASDGFAVDTDKLWFSLMLAL